MKKLILSLTALLTVACAFAFPKAIYVKQGDTYTKYSFGVAGDLKFTDNGHTLHITGYSDAIDLDKIDYISFSAPVDQTALAPSAQKQKLISIGEEVNNMADAYDQAELLRMFETFLHKHYDPEKDEYYKAPVEYSVPTEYWDVHNQSNKMMKAAADLSKGNPAGARALRNAVIYLYKVSDYFGIYTADKASESWVKTADADYLEIRFQSNDADYFRVHMEASADFTTWNTKHFNGQMPRTITLKLYKADTELAACTIKTELVQDTSIDMDLNFNANNYTVTDNIKVRNESITDNVKIYIKGKYLCETKSTVKGKNLVNYDDMYDAIKEASHYHDAQGNCMGEDPHMLMAHFTKAESEADIIGKLQVYGKGFGMTRIYDTLNEDAEKYYNLTNGTYRLGTSGKILNTNGTKYDVTGYESTIVDKHVLCLNNYLDTYFCYDGNKKLQGYLTWDNIDTVDDYYPETDARSAFTIVNGHLTGIYRDSNYEYINGDWVEVFGPWKYTWYDYNGNGEPIEVVVPENNVIRPSVIREHFLSATPMLTFPDLTTFMFEDFFSKISFQTLIDDYNEIINTYLTITGQEIKNDEAEY